MDQTDLATLVLSKPKLSQCYISVSCEVSVFVIAAADARGPIQLDPIMVFERGLPFLSCPKGTQKKTQEILRFLGTQKGADLCIKMHQNMFSGWALPGPAGVER